MHVTGCMYDSELPWYLYCIHSATRAVLNMIQLQFSTTNCFRGERPACHDMDKLHVPIEWAEELNNSSCAHCLSCGVFGTFGRFAALTIHDYHT